MPSAKLADHPGVRAVRQKSDPLADHNQIEIDRTTFFRSPRQIKLFREYAAGNQPMTLTDEQRDILDGLLANSFSDNVCHQVVAEAAARLDLLRFDCEDNAVKEFLDQFALRTNLGDFSGQTHYSSLRDGDYALTLGWDPGKGRPGDGRVTLLQEPWWDGQNGVFIAYSAQGEPLYAVKEWESLSGFRRRTVWFEDRIERYASDGGVWLPFALPSDSTAPGGGDGAAWPAGWIKSDGTPLHIPVIHFSNLSRGNGYSGFSVYGTSELDGGVLGFQDQINDLQMDISAAARMTGYQMITITGTPPPKDEAGNPAPFTVSPGGVLHSTDPAARFGRIEAGDISQLISTYQAKLRAVSRMTRTPLHSITGGDWPSGEALLRSELPAINKARAQIKKLSAAWIEVAHRATEIANVFSNTGMDEDAVISAVFAKPDQSSQLSMAAVVQTIAPYISADARLRLLDFTPAEIVTIRAEMKQDIADGLALPAPPPIPASPKPDIKIGAKETVS